MNSPAISIIVPVYKAEKYLHKCIDSILTQTFTDFEVLLIDDGSPDKSGEICDEYAIKDNRVRVFHKENGGVSSARQCGLDNAVGEYVIHADPDDWVEANMLECLFTIACKENSDMIICNYFWDKQNVSKEITQKPSSLKSEDVLSDLFKYLHGSMCNKLIKTECCKKYKISFPIGINLYEDLIFNIKLLQFPIKISYLNKAFYHYVQNVNINSLTRNYTSETLQREFYIRDYILTIIKGSTCEKRCLAYMNSIILQRAFFSGYFNGKEFRKYFLNMRKFIWSSYINIFIKLAIALSCIGLYTPIYKSMIFFRSHL